MGWSRSRHDLTLDTGKAVSVIGLQDEVPVVTEVESRTSMNNFLSLFDGVMGRRRGLYSMSEEEMKKFSVVRLVGKQARESVVSTGSRESKQKKTT